MRSCVSLILCLVLVAEFVNANVDSTLQSLSFQKEDSTKVISLATLAEKIQNNDPHLSDSLNHVALELSKRLKYTRGITFSLSNLTSLHILKGEYSEAEKKIQELTEIANSQNDLDLKIRMLNRLAIVQYYKGEFQKGIQINLEILDELSAFEYHESRLYAFNNIGINYEQLDEIDKALDYYHKALEIAREEENNYALGAIAGNMGVIYTNASKLDTAKVLISESISAAEKINNLNLLADETYNLAEILILEKNYLEATNVNNQSKEAAQTIDDRNGILKSISQKGRIYFYQSLYDDAIISLKESLALSEEINDREHRIELYDYLNRSYAALGNSSEAYHFLQLFTAEKDTVFNLEKTAELNRIEVQYLVAEKEKKLLSNQIEIERKTSQRNQLILISISLLIIATSIFYIMKYRINKNKQLADQSALIQSQKIRELEKEKKILSMSAMIDGQEAERIRIAKDLHDGLGGLLTTVRAQMTTVEKEITKLQNIKLYEKTNKMIDQACLEVSRISQNLMPSVLRLEGLKGAVEDISDQLRGVHQLETEIQLDFEGDKLSETQEMFVYRILQELSNNIVKHAKASEVLIQLIDYDDHLFLLVEDNGTGFEFSNQSEGQGIGLKSIRSRVDHLNGNVDFVSSEGEGTSVSINIPYTEDT